MNPALFADLVGKPYKRGARGPEEFDCWGLCKFLLERMGYANLPDEPTTISPTVNAERMQAYKHLFRRIEQRPGAIVLLRDELGIGSHVGVMVDARRFIHVSELRCSAVTLERLSDPHWSGRVMGFYEPNTEEER